MPHSKTRTAAQYRPLHWVCLLLLTISAYQGGGARLAYAAPYANPWWAQTSPNQESALPEVALLGISPEGVDLRTGELIWDQPLFDTPGLITRNDFSLRWRSMNGGCSQFGRSWIPSFQITALQVVLNSGDPNGPSGHVCEIRRPSGRLDTFTWNGTAYVAPADVFDVLTTDTSGNYVLTDKWNGRIGFDAQGLPATFTDANANVDTLAYNSALRITSYSDERGLSYGFTTNANGYITAVTDPFSRTWTLAYDANDNLLSVTTPATPDQTSGITYTFGYDSLHRLTSYTDGRGNSVYQVTYNGSSGQVASVSIAGNAITYTYGAGQTTRTDRKGYVTNYYFTGQQVTRTDMTVQSLPKYITQYRYTGVFPSCTVFPRGNRTDFVYSANGNLTQVRHRETDTNTAASTDLVHTWAYVNNLKASYTDPRGNITTFTRDAFGNLLTVTNPTVTSPITQTSSRTNTFNARGQPLTTTDEDGRVTQYEYYASGANFGLLYKMQADPAGLNLTTILEYDGAGNVYRITTPRGGVLQATWDALRRKVLVQAPLPFTYRTFFHYDGNGNIVTVDQENIDKDGVLDSGNPWISTTSQYNVTNQLVALTQEINASLTRTTQYQYDLNENRVRLIRAEGNKEAWEYNEQDWCTRHTRGETTASAASDQFEYDENGNLSRHLDGRGNATVFAYDYFDRKVRKTDPLGNYVSCDYDMGGNVTKTQVFDSAATELLREAYSYDERGRLWRLSALHKDSGATFSDAVTTRQYSPGGFLTSETDPRGNARTNTYDAAGRHLSSIDAMGNAVVRVYDANSNVIAQTIQEMDGSTTVTHHYESTFDALDRKTSHAEIDRLTPTNRLTRTFAYNSLGHRVMEVNPEGNPSRWTHDGLGRPTKQEVALAWGPSVDNITAAATTEWGYDGNDRRTSVKDDAQNVTGFAYDALDRLVTRTQPDNTTDSFVYDAADNLVQRTDKGGNVISDTFDAANRRVSRSVSRGPGVIDTTAELWTYDGANRVTSGSDDDYKVEFEYGALGLESFVHKEIQSYVGGTPRAKTMTSGYDPAGNRTSVTYQGGAQFLYGFDAANNRTTINTGGAMIASTAYIGLRPKGSVLQNGVTQAVTYTGYRGEVASLDYSVPGAGTFARFDYGYSKLHDLAFERYGGPGSPGDAFVYDLAGRLTKAYMGSATPENPATAQYTKTIDLALDDDGARSAKQDLTWLQPPVITSYLTNSRDMYTSVNGTARAHDGQGNLTDDGNFKYEYNYRNLLVQVRNSASNAPVVSYRYDVFGRRVEKQSHSTGAIERSVYSGNQLVQQYDAVTDLWKQNLVHWGDAKKSGRCSCPNCRPPFSVPPSILNQNPDFRVGGVIPLGGRTPVAVQHLDVLDHDGDNLVSEITLSYYHLNPAGSVMSMTDALGDEIFSCRYDPFGAQTKTRNGLPVTSDPIGQPFGWHGNILDVETGIISLVSGAVLDPATGSTHQGQGSDTAFQHGTAPGNPPVTHEYAPFKRLIDDAEAERRIGEIRDELQRRLKEAASRQSKATDGITEQIDDLDIWDIIAGAVKALIQALEAVDAAYEATVGAAMGWAVEQLFGVLEGALGEESFQSLMNSLSGVTELVKLVAIVRDTIADGTGLSKQAVDGAITILMAGGVAKSGLKALQGGVAKRLGRGANKLKPAPKGSGAHASFKRDAKGNVSGYAEYTPNAKNPSGFDEVKRVDTQYASPHSHYNNDTGVDVPTPHVHDKTVPGKVRPADPSELPP